MKKDLGIIFGLFIALAALIVFGKGFTSTNFIGNIGQATPSATASSNLAGTNQTISIKNLIVNVEIADQASERKKGLSGRNSLPLANCMLFVFEQSGPYPIWMKDMKFAIDIIWIDEGKKIVDIVIGAPPEPGKKDDELTIYKPRGSAKYILEINAGLVNLNNIQIGDEVKF